MSNSLIKICGVRDLEIAEHTAKAGANFIGIIFDPSSKRYVEIQQAKLISRITKAHGAKPVAVFVNHTADEMNKICEITDIQIIQLHGNISRSQHVLLPKNYQRIYVRPVLSTGEIINDANTGLTHCDAARDFLLFDTTQPGKGNQINWETFEYTGEFRWFLAGGLTADNVASAIQLVNPTGVDVSSGVENATGEKELKLIKKFIHSVKEP